MDSDGFVLLGIGKTQRLINYQGLWPLMAHYATQWTHTLAKSTDFPILSKMTLWLLTPFLGKNVTIAPLLGINISHWIMMASVIIHFAIISARVRVEEKMLQQHFGHEWDEYASKRWRFIPLIY
ncbi:hypothetical protein BG004_001566 [Podila humilis]|nr:hypothetical protein BG004_001566 [Podila humilis]